MKADKAREDEFAEKGLVVLVAKGRTPDSERMRANDVASSIRPRVLGVEARTGLDIICLEPVSTAALDLRP